MSNHPINLSRDTGLLRPALGKSISATQSPGRHQWKRGNMWKGGGWRRRRGVGGRGRGCLIYWFNSCRCSSLCLLREGGQMEHAAQNTQTKSHFLSTSQPLRVSRSLSSPPPIPSSLPLCRIFLTFRRRLRGLTGWRTDWLTPSAQQRPRWKWKSVEPSTYLTDSVTCWLCVCEWFFFVLFCVFFANAVQRARPTQQSWEMRPPSKLDLQN